LHKRAGKRFGSRSRLVEDAECHLDRLGLASGAAQVRFERMAEPAVGVRISGEGGTNRRRGTVPEVVGEPQAVDQPRVEQEVPFGGGECVGSHSLHEIDATAADAGRS
jgi:hypothetical protein